MLSQASQSNTISDPSDTEVPDKSMIRGMISVKGLRQPHGSESMKNSIQQKNNLNRLQAIPQKGMVSKQRVD